MPVFKILWELTWKIGLLFVLGWFVFMAFLLGLGFMINAAHQANAPPDRVIEYIDCDKYPPMMRDQRCIKK